MGGIIDAIQLTDGIFTNDPDGQASMAPDDALNGNGTGVPGEQQDPVTDEDKCGSGHPGDTGYSLIKEDD